MSEQFEEDPLVLEVKKTEKTNSKQSTTNFRYPKRIN